MINHKKALLVLGVAIYILGSNLFKFDNFEYFKIVIKEGKK